MGTQNVDILIIGAGPAGLYGAYYAGFRGMSVGLMDSLEEPGGQITAMYPEKAIFDVGGFSSIKGKDLIDNLLTQAKPSNPKFFLNQTATTLKQNLDASKLLYKLVLNETEKIYPVVIASMESFEKMKQECGTASAA